MESPCCLSHRQVKRRGNSSIRANITEERRTRKSRGGGGGPGVERFFPMHNCCEGHVVLEVHPLFYFILFYFIIYLFLCLYVFVHAELLVCNISRAQRRGVRGNCYPPSQDLHM